VGLRDAIIAFLLRFASDPATVSNPYTRAHMVKAMYGFIPTHRRDNASALRSPLDGDGAGREGLVRVLMRFFVDMERTGANDAFYTKFTHRFHALTLLDYLWEDGAGAHRAAVAEVAVAAPRELEAFLNMVLNDMHHCLAQARRPPARPPARPPCAPPGAARALPARLRAGGDGVPRRPLP